MKRRFLIFLLIAAVPLLCGCGENRSELAGKNYPILTVTPSCDTMQVSRSAVIRGRQDIEIYPQISGKITKVLVSEGEKVKKGQILFVIDRIPYEAALRVAEANLTSAIVGVESAELDYKSTKELYDSSVVSAYDLQSALNSLHAAQATMAQMEAQKINAANDLSYTEVTSPSDGVVGTLPFREGSLVSPSMSDPLTTVSDNSEMYVYFSMNENRLLDIAEEYGTVENAVKSMPDIQLRLSNGSVYRHSGRIVSISGVINDTTGTVSVRSVFPNPEGLLHSGANGSVLIPEYYANVIIIPQEATFEIQDKVLAYKVVDGKAKSVKIEVSPASNGKEYIVTGGLEPGDEIIASGAGLVREGSAVKTTGTVTEKI